MHHDTGPCSYQEDARSPRVAEGQEALRLTLDELRLTDGTASVGFHLSFLFPPQVADRYERLHEAVVLVVHDLDQRDGFVVRLVNDFVKLPPDERDRPNVLAPPALPLPPRGEPRGDAYHGGFVHGSFSFPAPRPLRSPGVHVYAVLENFVSNVVALDLCEPAIVA